MKRGTDDQAQSVKYNDLVCGCTFGIGLRGDVRPKAEHLAMKLQRDPTPIDLKFLSNRKFAETDGVIGPLVLSGRCYEKARGNPRFGGMAGIDVVRVCIGDNPTQVFVFNMHTHGERWTEVYPNDTRTNDPSGDSRSKVSDETKKRLRQ